MNSTVCTCRVKVWFRVMERARCRHYT